MSSKFEGLRGAGMISGLAVASCLSAWLGCSPTAGSAAGGRSGDGGTGSDNAGGSGNVVTGTGSVVGAGGDFIGFGGSLATTGGGGNGGGDECGATTLEAETIYETHVETHTETVERVSPIAIYMMQDQSGSMFLLWGFATQAITSFVTAPESAGLHVAMNFFPASINDCTGNAYATPEVPWGVLGPPTNHETAITTTLSQHGPIGLGTPIEDALRGVIKGCQNFEQANPEIPCYALLLTDGGPSDCAAKESGVYQTIVSDGLAAGVPVYTVGINPGADMPFLDTLAQAAGTDCNGAAAGLTCNAASGAEFTTALNSLRETLTDVIVTEEVVEVPVTVPLDCEWAVPTGQDQDLDKMTVRFTDQGTGVVTDLGRVLDPANCDAVGGPAWHYDSEAAPTKLIACPAVCTSIKAVNAKIDILAGCEVEILDVR